ncbi:MAG: hypothetical protein NZM42_01770 [Gemmatales bacterium]|nr:hypothetical protein [Gemmatales bacterium]
MAQTVASMAPIERSLSPTPKPVMKISLARREARFETNRYRIP